MTSLGNKQVFAKNLSYYIERSGKSQKDIANVVGVATTTFNDWVKAKKYPRIDKIESLANYFGIQKSDLIEDKEKPTDIYDGLTLNQVKLIEFAKSVPEEKAEMILQVMKTIVENKQ